MHGQFAGYWCTTSFSPSSSAQHMQHCHSFSCFARQQETVVDGGFCYMVFLWWYSNNRCCRNFMADWYWSSYRDPPVLVLWLCFSPWGFFIKMVFSLFPSMKFIVTSAVSHSAHLFSFIIWICSCNISIVVPFISSRFGWMTNRKVAVSNAE